MQEREAISKDLEGIQSRCQVSGVGNTFHHVHCARCQECDEQKSYAKGGRRGKIILEKIARVI